MTIIIGRRQVCANTQGLFYDVWRGDMALGRLTHIADAVTASTGNYVEVSLPNASITAGDLLLAFTVLPSGSRTLAWGGTSTGWTVIEGSGSTANGGQSGHTSQLAWKLATNADKDATLRVTPSTGAVKQLLMVAKISGVDPANPVFTSASTFSTLGGTTRNTPDIVGLPAGSREISIVADSVGAGTTQTTWTPPSGFVEARETVTLANGSQASSAAWGDSNVTFSGDGGNRDWISNTSAVWSAWSIGIAEAPSTPLNAGPDQAVEAWSTVTLNGTGIAPFTWTQTAGPAVTLSGTGASRTFVAPGLAAGATLTFSLDDGTVATPDSVTVTVYPATEFYRTAAGAWEPIRPLSLP